MRILIAESKTMTDCGAEVGPELLADHRPRLDSIATTFMRGWSEWKPEEISAALKVSPALASEFLKVGKGFSYFVILLVNYSNFPHSKPAENL